MNSLKLVFPTLAHKEAALAYRQEYFDNGEMTINGDGGLDTAESYEEWIEKIKGDLTRCDAGRVPSTTYFAVAGSKIVGTIQIRHRLNDFLLSYGGHIGYGVVPSERRKGYASRMLFLALRKCSSLGIGRVLVTCDKANTASARTIMKNGGILENEIPEDGRITQRYWIDNPDCEIKPVSFSDLPACLDVIRTSFATVAAEFGLTEQNCPAHTSFMKFEKLDNQYTGGYRMYGLYDRDKVIGYFSLSPAGTGIFELHNLCVLPEYRHCGYGRRLIEYAAGEIRGAGGTKIVIGIIEENIRLKSWYAANGFVHTGTKKFPHLPFTAGYMELELKA